MTNASKTKYAYVGITAAFLLVSPLAPVSEAVAQGSNRPRISEDDANRERMKAFEGSNYGYCDAQVLGKLWKLSTWDAKLQIGQKILWKDQSVINQALRDGFRVGTCDQAFNYDDAPKIAELWTAARA